MAAISQSLATGQLGLQHSGPMGTLGPGHPHHPGGFFPLRSGVNMVQFLFEKYLGIEPIWVLNASLAAAAVGTCWNWLRHTAYRTIAEHIVSRVTIHDGDPLYETMLRFMHDKYLPVQTSRAARAVTVKTTTVEDDERTMDLLQKANVNGDDILNYRGMIGKSPIEFQYESVQHLFWHRRRIYWFKHHRGDRAAYRQRMDHLGMVSLREACSLSFECLGRSAEPIRRLITDAQEYALSQPGRMIRVCRAMANPDFFVQRPARDIDTVILEKAKKSALLADMNEYLHPRTRRWYSSHGIPYRRGYLFSGPPGTGKSSLCASLAGLFGLDIQIVSLLEGVSDASLSDFFNNLSSRCIVLLEDIDAAGLKREEEDDDEGTVSSTARVPLAVVPSRRWGRPRRVRMGSSRVTLSGLLNALDGVASQEGRIVIMTTNQPDKLDEALIRPGRVDMHVRFELPTRRDMHDMFISMYRSLVEETQIPGAQVHEHISRPELEETADRFAQLLPEKRLSLAEIQGYLLKHKDMPRSALDCVATWAAEVERERRRQEERSLKRELANAKATALAKAQHRLKQAKFEARARDELQKLRDFEESSKGSDKESKAMTNGDHASEDEQEKNASQHRTPVDTQARASIEVKHSADDVSAMMRLMTAPQPLSTYGDGAYPDSDSDY